MVTELMTIFSRPELHTSATTSNLLSLLQAPINSYQSVLTLLALTRFTSLLSIQTFSTRRSLAHAVISSVLKNETYIETPEDVSGVLELCHVLIKDQKDAGVGMGGPPTGVRSSGGMSRGPSSMGIDMDDLAEEQGWVARMIHLFRADSLDVQNEVSLGLELIRCS